MKISTHEAIMENLLLQGAALKTALPDLGDWVDNTGRINRLPSRALAAVEHNIN